MKGRYYIFEQFRVPHGCLGYLTADSETRLAVLGFLYTPGHARDLVSVVLVDLVLTANVLLIGSCGRACLPNGNVHIRESGFTGNVQKEVSSVRLNQSW